MKKVLVIVFLIILLILVSFPLLFGLLYVHKLEKDLNNPIINNGYEGWHSVSVDSNVEIKLPKTWSLHSGDTHTISDDEGSLVAIGLKCELCSDEQWMELLSNCTSNTVVSYENAYFSNNHFGNMASVWIAVCELESGQKENVLCLILRDHDSKYYFCFTDDNEMRRNEVEAIAYSMS